MKMVLNRRSTQEMTDTGMTILLMSMSSELRLCITQSTPLA